MKILYWDCFAGISGDMALGALLDLGADLEEVQVAINGLGFDGLSLKATKVAKGGIAATGIHISFPADPQPHRTFKDILAILASAALTEEVKEKSRRVFRVLARAEGKIHGKDPDQVHFHEVGALDSLVDIVGSVAALETLKPQRIIASALPFSRGQVRCAHGVLPLPAPATLEICREASIPMVPPPQDVAGELVTPTGAALVAALADSFGPVPPLWVKSVGYGAGTKNFPFPNVLRLLLAETEAEGEGLGDVRTEENILLEVNIDDMSPELYEHLSEQLFRGGALDVFLTPVHMKKNRPGVKLSVLTAHKALPSLRDVIFRETTSIGLRETRVTKRELPRTMEKVETRWGPINVKVSTLRGKAVNRAPEYRDCLKAAREHGVPLKVVYDAVRGILGREEE